MEQEPLSMGEAFRMLCPTFLSYGMTYDQYWHGDPWMVVDYAKAYKIRMEERNWEMWMQGLYIYDAFSVVLSNAFAAKGSTPKKYLLKPEPIFPMTEEEKQAEDERELRKMIRNLNQWEKSFNGKNDDPSE